MKISKLRLPISTLIALAMTLSTMHVVKAFVQNGKWISKPQYYRFNSTVPTGYRAYIINAANTWTDVTPSSWVWNASTTKGMWIYYQNIDGPGNAGALTNRIILLGIITSATMTIDSSENWYAGTGLPGASQYDLQGAVTHEMGHGLGLGHTSGIYCPYNSNDATMCESMPPGSYIFRTLEGDDRNGVNAIYP